MQRPIKSFTLFIILTIFCLGNAHAGDRGIDIGICNITQGKQSKTCLRLFELLQKEIKELYSKGHNGDYAWSAEEFTPKNISPSKLKHLFKPMILLQDRKAFVKAYEKAGVSDGIIIYEYDNTNKNLRLKLFDYNGKELALIKVPLEKDGSMKDSVYKAKRRGIIHALGMCVEFSP